MAPGIAYERSGSGPALILVGGAFSCRRFPKTVQLAELLADRFTVFNYDRRGDSSDAERYAVQREIEDLAAMIGWAGGSAHVYGMSSGGVWRCAPPPASRSIGSWPTSHRSS